MINKLIDDIKNIDKNILKIMFSGFKFCFLICILSFIILLTYIIYPTSYTLFEASIILFQTGLIFAASFFVCGFVVNNLKK